MRTQDISIGTFYRHRAHPTYCYAKALEVLKPKPAYRCKTELEKEVTHTVVKCSWTVDKTDTTGFIKYFKPCDLVSIQEVL